MNFSPAERERLLTLLDAVCEQRASPDQLLEVEALVLASPEARWAYLTYLDLHGTLTWDAGGGLALVNEMAAPVTLANSGNHRRRWLVTSIVSACVVLLLGILVGRYSRTPVDEPREMVTAPSEPLPVSPEPRSVAPRRPIELSARPAPAGTELEPLSPTHSEGPIVSANDGLAPDDFEFDLMAKGPLDEVTEVSRRIDRELARAWHDAAIVPSPQASDEAWLRRVMLDLTGRIPTVDEVESFTSSAALERNTASADSLDPVLAKRRALVDRLLAEGEHVRHFTTVWTNLLIGRSSPDDVNREAFQKFLRMNFAENRPWNAMVADLLSAEGRTDENGATNYLVAHLNNQAVPATAITSRIFLGQALHCAQCHNHPFNDVQQAAFWELNSLFQQTQVVHPADTRPRQSMGRRRGPAIAALVTQPEGGPIYYETTNGLMKVAFPRFNGQDVDPAPQVNRRRELARLLTTTDQPQLAAAFVNRVWAHFLGAGFTSPVDDMGPHNPPCHPELLNLLRDEFIRSGYDIRQLVRWITATDAYQRVAHTTEQNEIDDPSQSDVPLFSRIYPKVMSAEQLYDSLLTATRAHTGGVTDWTAAEARRRDWLEEFVISLENDENDEAETLSGTYSQALTLMNGDLMQHALDLGAGTFLGEMVRSKLTEAERVERLYLAALSRSPTARELAAMQRLARESSVRKSGTARPSTSSYQDIFWALLNSNEFAIVH